MNCYAAGWQQNQNGWWWQYDDASWPAATWQWLDGNGDGTAECYYFDGNGYMLAGTTTPGGYQVDGEGRWCDPNKECHWSEYGIWNDWLRRSWQLKRERK